MKYFHNWIFTKAKGKKSLSVKAVVKEVLTELDIPFTDECCPTDSDPDNLTNRELTAGGVGGGSGWALEGNAGTDGGTADFIGTTDDVDIVIKRNDVDKITITSSLVHIDNGFQLTDGTEGEGKRLTSDLNGIGTWEFQVKPVVTIVTASGSHTITAGTNYIKIQVQGAGGGSGGTDTGVANSMGYAGGGGAYFEGFLDVGDITGTDLILTIGAGGIAGVGDGANGGTGGSTTVADGSGNLVVCTGGLGGASQQTAENIGGVGGTTTTVDAIVEESFRLNGMPGGFIIPTARVGGIGGGTYLGRGGTGSSPALTTGNTGYGAGAHGTYTNSTTAVNGIAGSNGVVIITEYL